MIYNSPQCGVWSSARVQCTLDPLHSGPHEHRALSWSTKWQGDDGPPPPEKWIYTPNLGYLPGGEA